jgi:uncharacterized protein (TIGR04168 family)
LRRFLGERQSFHRDEEGTAYLNCACVPRHGSDDRGRSLRHFSWIRFQDGELSQVSHRWYGLTGDLLYEQTLWSAAALSRC